MSEDIEVGDGKNVAVTQKQKNETDSSRVVDDALVA